MKYEGKEYVKVPEGSEQNRCAGCAFDGKYADCNKKTPCLCTDQGTIFTLMEINPKSIEREVTIQIKARRILNEDNIHVVLFRDGALLSEEVVNDNHDTRRGITGTISGIVNDTIFSRGENPE